jgi:hypothetical protein
LRDRCGRCGRKDRPPNPCLEKKDALGWRALI